MIDHLKILGAVVVISSTLIIVGMFLACTTILHDCATYGKSSLPGNIKVQCSIINEEK